MAEHPILRPAESGAGRHGAGGTGRRGDGRTLRRSGIDGDSALGCGQRARKGGTAPDARSLVHLICGKARNTLAVRPKYTQHTRYRQ